MTEGSIQSLTLVRVLSLSALLLCGAVHRNAYCSGPDCYPVCLVIPQSSKARGRENAGSGKTGDKPPQPYGARAEATTIAAAPSNQEKQTATTTAASPTTEAAMTDALRKASLKVRNPAFRRVPKTALVFR